MFEKAKLKGSTKFIIPIKEFTFLLIRAIFALHIGGRLLIRTFHIFAIDNKHHRDLAIRPVHPVAVFHAMVMMVNLSRHDCLFLKTQTEL